MPLGQHLDTERSSAELFAAPHAELAADLNMVAGSLHEQYDSRLGVAVVDTEIQLVADRFTDAKIRSFVPLFVRRYAAGRMKGLCAQQSDPSPSPSLAAQP